MIEETPALGRKVKEKIIEVYKFEREKKSLILQSENMTAPMVSGDLLHASALVQQNH